MSNVRSSIDLLKTPDKLLNISASFSPTDNSSPSRDLTGPSRTAYTHALSLNSYINQWRSLHNKGLVLCRSIQALKLHEIISGNYPSQLTSICSSLLECVQGMEYTIEGMTTVSKQLNALAKLCISPEPIVNTWSASKVAAEVEKCLLMYSSELDLKKTVIENICHCQDEFLTELYVSSWEYNMFIDGINIECFQSEMGFSKQAIGDN